MGSLLTWGGFHAFVREDTGKGPLIHDSDEPYYPLDEIEVIKMFRNGELDLPLESEIQDRSKADWLGKTLVILQTGWFVTQCIARFITHLRLSGLEVVTLAYTTVNVAIYIAWWNKPRDVDRPIRVYIPRETAEARRAEALNQAKSIRRWADFSHRSSSEGKSSSEDVYELYGYIFDSIFPGSSRKGKENFAAYTSVPTFHSGISFSRETHTFHHCNGDIRSDIRSHSFYRLVLSISI
ncbi:hypothetical protein CPB86DRAFT_323628 [Serendipita vermifera]|nr:hypothetical protein CPB86DRAFT_323628 [Serendipita vermifera]